MCVRGWEWWSGSGIFHQTSVAVSDERLERVYTQTDRRYTSDLVSLPYMMSLYRLMVVGLVVVSVNWVNSENSTIAEDVCGADAGPWSLALEDWATAVPHSDRHGRIMALAPAQGYYVTERIDTPLLQPPPPPPPPGPPVQPGQPGAPVLKSGYKAPQRPRVPQGYSEWEAPAGPGKIVNKPPAPYKDKFKPSYPLPPGSPQYPGGVDRVDETPQKQVSETDLYLLSAMEKLVYRADQTEKRLRKVEETLHYLMAGNDKKPETCAGNFTRVGGGCYQWSREVLDWKDASRACRRRSAALLELPRREDARALITALLADNKLKGDDFWTGGLNPGLLWIWSNSARPIQSNTTDNATVTISGEGRCLALVHEPAVHSYRYRGQDCSTRLRYICQLEPATLSNEIEKTARALRHQTREARRLLHLDIQETDSDR